MGRYRLFQAIFKGTFIPLSLAILDVLFFHRMSLHFYSPSSKLSVVIFLGINKTYATQILSCAERSQQPYSMFQSTHRTGPSHSEQVERGRFHRYAILALTFRPQPLPKINVLTAVRNKTLIRPIEVSEVLTPQPVSVVAEKLKASEQKREEKRSRRIQANKKKLQKKGNGKLKAMAKAKVKST